MERYFKIKRTNTVYKEYFDWWNNLDILKKKWEQFRKLEGIESTEIAFGPQLCIIPTQNDLIKFGRFFYKQDYGKGLRKFKQTSTMQNDWQRFCFSNDIKFLQKPIISFEFGLLGKTRTRLFHYKDDVYCSLDNERLNKDSKIPDGYEEMKASEFYKIIEIIEGE